MTIKTELGCHLVTDADEEGKTNFLLFWQQPPLLQHAEWCLNGERLFLFVGVEGSVIGYIRSQEAWASIQPRRVREFMQKGIWLCVWDRLWPQRRGVMSLNGQSVPGESSSNGSLHYYLFGLFSFSGLAACNQHKTDKQQDFSPSDSHVVSHKHSIITHSLLSFKPNSPHLSLLCPLHTRKLLWCGESVLPKVNTT